MSNLKSIIKKNAFSLKKKALYIGLCALNPVVISCGQNSAKLAQPAQNDKFSINNDSYTDNNQDIEFRDSDIVNLHDTPCAEDNSNYSEARKWVSSTIIKNDESEDIDNSHHMNENKRNRIDEAINKAINENKIEIKLYHKKEAILDFLTDPNRLNEDRKSFYKNFFKKTAPQSSIMIFKNSNFITMKQYLTNEYHIKGEILDKLYMMSSMSQ